jgi:hypothetical protein
MIIAKLVLRIFLYHPNLDNKLGRLNSRVSEGLCWWLGWLLRKIIVALLPFTRQGMVSHPWTGEILAGPRVARRPSHRILLHITNPSSSTPLWRTGQGRRGQNFLFILPPSLSLFNALRHPKLLSRPRPRPAEYTAGCFGLGGYLRLVDCCLSRRSSHLNVPGDPVPKRKGSL